jgi:CBS domain containing-hemolysin-like protein
VGSFIIALICVALAFVALTLRKTYYYLPEAELKREAKSGDHLGKVLWSAVAYGTSLQLLLWLLIGVFAAVGFVLFARVAPPIFGFLAVALLLWFAFAWMPTTRLTRLGARLSVWFTPIIVWLLRWLHRPLDWFLSLAHRFYPAVVHTGLYQKDDLLELIARQKQQPDNRVPIEELELAERALTFERIKVRDVLISRKKVKAVGRGDAVGPILLDELHATGHSRFPVYGKDENDIVGTIHLISLDEAKQGGHVRDFMDKGVAYVHEGDTLADALHAVYTTKHQLFLVVNSFEEYVGILTLEDILHALVGHLPADEFDAHHNRVAVAARHPAKKKSKPAEEKPAEEKSMEESASIETTEATAAE